MAWSTYIIILLASIFYDQAAAQCDSGPCGAAENVCIDNGNVYLCLCSDGSSGTFCGTPATTPVPQVCDPSPCLNSGACFPVGDSFTCFCTTGWSGTLCETNVACDSNPCLNSGVCVNEDAGGFTCLCATSYYGIQCENQCDDGVSVINCLTNYNPCDYASCADSTGVPISGATCVFNQCGGCNAEFVDSLNNGITCFNNLCISSSACASGEICYEEWLPGPRNRVRCD